MLYEYHNTVCEILNEYLKKNYQNGYRKETIEKLPMKFMIIPKELISRLTVPKFL